MQVVVKQPNRIKNKAGGFLGVDQLIDVDPSTAEFWIRRGWVAAVISGSPTSKKSSSEPDIGETAMSADDDLSQLSPGPMFSDAEQQDPED